MFRHNAGIYGVAERISFVHDDFAHFAEHYTGPKIDAVFLSPPWGGPGHLDCPHFSLRDVEARVVFFINLVCGYIVALWLWTFTILDLSPNDSCKDSYPFHKGFSTNMKQ